MTKPSVASASSSADSVSGIVVVIKPSLVPEPARDHGLGADAEPARGVTAEGAAEAEWHEEDGRDHNETVDERLPDVQAGEQLGQKDQEARAQHRAEQRGEPTQDDDRDELDR